MSKTTENKTSNEVKDQKVDTSKDVKATEKEISGENKDSQSNTPENPEAAKQETKSSEKKTKAKKSTSKSNKKKVEILCSNAAGKYNLSYNKGEKTTLDVKQADLMIDAGDAKAV